MKLETVDHHYYQSFDQIGEAFYDWERQFINLGCNRSDTGIDAETPPTQVGSIESSKLVHEYIHFLQNFCTAWGANVFTDFCLSMMKIGASADGFVGKLTLPLEQKDLNNQLLIDGLSLRESVIQRLNKCGAIDKIDTGEIKKIDCTLVPNRCIILCNGILSAEIGIKAVREHMAHIGTQLYLQKSDYEIHKYNSELFIEAGKQFAIKPEYWMLFEFVYQEDLFTLIGRGVFQLTQNCLITLNPEKAILRFIAWYASKKQQFEKGTSFTFVVDEWINLSSEKLFFTVGYERSLKHCEEILKMAEKFQETNDLARITMKLTEYAIKNIKANGGGKTLFLSSDDFSDFNFWKKKMHSYGTGLIRYLDGVIIHGNKEHVDDMAECFYFLLSGSLVIKKILLGQKSFCPFLVDIPICNASFKDHDNCYKNPFLMVKEEEEGKKCLFGNGVLLTGMTDRLSFEN